ncbi:RNA polymerase-binding protein RbpA [Allokutzneria albata]|uniref:RNA polymerase-binding protein RbpA n=1 Tax=Allokutzneria albata TaxID=211114 RepID=A0A1G9R3C4_ALLAB|nr:RNA polymerase-binding protein RbpA [Allokutzneria albata]SDM17630.1 RNA polymerase-binding protein [Allokutzneria albata]
MIRAIRAGGGPQYPQPATEAPAARRTVVFVCPQGHNVEVTFAADAETPEVWECPKHGTESRVWYSDTGVGGEENAVPRTGKTHWEQLCSRRSEPELEQLLAERLSELRAARVSVG